MKTMIRRACAAACVLLTTVAHAESGKPTVQSLPRQEALPQPTVIPAAPGNQPLLNPAPAPENAPANSAGTTPETTVTTPVIVVPPSPDSAPVLLTPKRMQTGCSLRDYGAPVERGQTAAAIVNTCSGFSLHKPTFLMPFTYSPIYNGKETEFIFQLSAKAQLWDYGPGALYFGYTQISFFQIYNTERSKPFRENNFNPELFTRIPQPFKALPNWSFDLGLEHTSNGEDLPNSRSFNRIYVQPYWQHGRDVVLAKFWYRLPEDKSLPRTDPNRDDNPDLGSYLGYGELHYRHDMPWRDSLVDVMVRANPATGRGAIQADYSFEVGPVGALFFRAFNGYGESLIDYNRSMTRIGVGIALQR